MHFDSSSERYRDDRRRLPKTCKAALVDVEDRLTEHPTGGGEEFAVSRIEDSLFEYEQWDPHLRILYVYDEKEQRIAFKSVRTMAFEDPLVFISYSRKDEAWMKLIHAKLEEAFAKSKLTFWTDKQIAPGDKWKTEIRNKLASALAALLLVSKSFMESSFIQEVELPACLESPQVKLLWLKIGRCNLKSNPMGERVLEHQAVVDPAKPLEELPESELETKLKKVRQALIASVLNPLFEGSRGA